MVGRVSLAELAAAGFVIQSAEAAAIVIDVCRQLERGAIRGIPSTHVIRLTPDGIIVAEGPITTDQPPIAKAALLLNDLLPSFDAPPAYRVPGGLRLVVARALGTLDLPPFASVEEFCEALSRFAANDLVSAMRNLYRAWELAKTPRVLTISDVRRARRATGLSLEDISSVCGVDASLLRELEWGYLKNWRNDGVGRSWLSGYAKASGLDEQLVSSIVVPMLDEAAPPPVDRAVAAREEVALVPAAPQTIVPARALLPQPRSRRWIVCAAAAAASIVLLAMLTILAWPRPAVLARLEPMAPPFVPAPVTAPMPAPIPAPLIEDVRPVRDLVSVIQRHSVDKPRVAKARPAVKRAAPPPPRKAASKPNFFKRQLLRIVIK